MASYIEDLHHYYNYRHTKEFTRDTNVLPRSKSVHVRLPLSDDDMDYEIQKYINLINKD
jgi:hypothetical protein